MDKEFIVQRIERDKIIAVIRGDDEASVFKRVEDCVSAGICLIELTFTILNVVDLISGLSAKYGDSVILGAGSVLDSESARLAILNGARFIVSPIFNDGVAKLCNRYRVLYIAGCMSVNEITKAMEAGVDLIKLFPASVLGIDFVKAVHAPMPFVKFVATGGIDLNNFSSWLSAGVCACCVGSSLTNGDVKANAKEFLRISNMS